MVRINPKRKINYMIKNNFLGIFLLIYVSLILTVNSAENDIYKKIDLFGEVLKK